MAGSQFGLNYKDLDYDYNLNNLYYNVISSIQRLYDVYNLTHDDIVYFQVSFRQIDYKFLSDLSFDCKHLDKAGKTTLKLNFPLTIDKNILGKPISDIYLKNGKFSSVNFKLEDNSGDLIDKVNNKNNISALTKPDYKANNFYDKYSFYLRDSYKPANVLAVKVHI